ncbi:amino acid adenylation domain-containing protein, partial [Nostoc cf. edaphicum LEGE 07299]
MTQFSNNFQEMPPQYATIIDILRDRSCNIPGTQAFTFLEDGETQELTLTYHELDRRSRAVAAQLQALGLSGKRAILLYPPGLDYLIAFFGCLYAGVVAIPAYPPSNQRKTPRIQAISIDAQASIALTTTAMLPTLQSILTLLTKQGNFHWLTTDNIAQGIEDSWQQPAINQDTLAFLQYTSGSTGIPKGVMLSHGNLLHNAAVTYQMMEHSPSSKFVSWLPIYHDMGLIGGILQPLYGGFPCVLMSPTSFLQRPYRWLQAISRYKGTTSGGPNFAYELCVQRITQEQKETLDLSSWSVAFNGAEPVRQDTLELFATTFAECGFRQEAFYPCYGMAEATLIVSGGIKTALAQVKTVEKSALSQNQIVEATTENQNIQSFVSCGETIPQQQIVIVNPETLTRCSSDEVGEIWVSGLSVGQGYWNRTEETEQTFHAYLKDTKEGPFLRTGDLGFLANGELFITGRAKDLIIIRGRNLYPQDIELTAQGSHPSLRSGANAAFTVEVNNEERLVVVQELEFRAKPNLAEVASAIRQSITEEHEVQVYGVVLIKPGTIPKTSSGKIQRRGTRAQFENGELNVVESDILKISDIARNETKLQRSELLALSPRECQPILESYLIELLAGVLSIAPDDINPQEPLSTLGLDSLKVFELKNRIEVDLEVEVSVADFFEGMSTRSLVTKILAQIAADAIPSISLTQLEKTTSTQPLSYAQQGLWFINQLNPDTSTYNIPIVISLQGCINLVALQDSLNEIIQRHEVLRTSFTIIDGQPAQVVNQAVPLTLAVEDLHSLSDSECTQEAQRLAMELAQEPFDLSCQSLLRAKILFLNDSNYQLLVTLHHIIADGWSIGILIKELAALYEAFSTGKLLPLPKLPIQYRDFVNWQRQWLDTKRIQPLLTYWKQKLSGELTVLNLPTDRVRRSFASCRQTSLVQTFKGGQMKLVLSQTLTKELKNLSRQEGVTLFMTLLTAFKSLLYRYTGQTDIVVGSPIASRNRAETESLIGFFVNVLVLRTDLSGDLSFQELLERVKSTALEAYIHQDLPFEKLVEELQPTRDLSYNPLFQVMFVLQNMPKPDLSLSDVSITYEEGYNGTSKFDLTLFMEDSEQGLVTTCEYNTDLFNADTITRMLGHFQTVLESIVSDVYDELRLPQQRIADLQLLTPSEVQQLFEWNDTKTDYSQDNCIHELFEAQVEKTPDAIAAVFEDQKLTYGELNANANQLAHHLRLLGVKPEVLVGICVERSLSMVIGLLAILKAGGAYIPLDPSYPQERLAYMLEDSQPSVLLTQQHLVESLSTHKAKVVYIDGNWGLSVGQNTRNTACNITCDNLAYVIYTSGSTGKPKGAMNTHRGICNRLLWMQDAYQLTAADSVLQKTPFSFDVSVWEFFWPLIAGARLVIAQPEGHRDPNYLVNLITEQQITTLHFVPSMLQVFLEAKGLEKCQSLVRVIASGEALSAQLQQRFFNRLDAQLHNLYGPTEAAVDVTFWECKDCVTNQKIVPIGRPIANIQIYLLDKYLNPVAIGVTGEVYIGGVGVGRGYLNRPELTAEKFIPNPFSNEAAARLYKTGDLARYLPNGEIEYIGRIDYQVKIRGFRIELGEIEAVITQHPAARETVVLVRDDSVDFQRIVAYVVPQKEQILTTFELRDFLESKLPSYMIPGAFIILEALPLTPNGKVDRKALPIPELTQISSSNIILPSTPIENLLAGIWAEILGIEKVGIDNNFFELGGHSLIATRVISRIRQVFQVELPLGYLFEKPTIAGLAKEIEKAIKIDSADEVTNIERIVRSPELPLSFAQQRLWFLAQLEPNSPFYNMPAAVRLKGQLNVEALQQSFNQIINRHGALRTNFQTLEGQAIAVIHEVMSLTLSVFDISELPLNQQEAEVKKQTSQEAQKPFDLNGDLLLRVKLLRLGQQEHILLLTMHHIVSDGWSIDVLVRELATLYQAFCDGQPSPLPELPIQYVDFAAWQRQWLQGNILKTQTSYWLKQLKNAPKVLELPTDYPRPVIQTFRGSTYSFKLSDKLSFALNKFSQQQGSTLFMTLLAAFQTLLWRYTGSEDIVVGSPIANRNRAEIEGLIGFFVNTLALRTNFAGNPSFEELFKRVREVALGAYAHQDLPFELLVEELQPQRDLSHTPLFQVMFVLQNTPMSALELPGLTLSPLKSNSHTAKFDLTLYITETVDGLLGDLEYNTDLFKESSIQRMVAHLQTLLEGIVANSKQRLSELPILTKFERHQLLIEWNDTEEEYPQQQCIHQLFEAQVEKTPDAVAVVFEEEQLTYQELNSRANQLGHHLRSLGVKPEVLVGICIERSLSMVIGLLAILKAGGAYIPLDPAYPQERLAFILEDTQAPVLLTQASLVEVMPQHKAQVVCLDVDSQTIAQKSKENLFCELTTDNLAYVIYTSGSTGKPKGVQIPHTALSNFLYSMRQTPGLTHEDTLLAVTTYSFDIAALELFLPIIIGGCLVIASREVASDGTQLSAKLTDSKATVMQATPATWQLLLAAGWDANKQLKILCGGEALPGQLANQLLHRCACLWNMYGPTETTIWSAASQVENGSTIVPISGAIANTQLYILDQYSQLVPVGVAGELHIGGEGLARGYFNRPDLTAEKFIPNPFSKKAARLYKTGDLARYLPNGQIEYIGRIDNQVKVRGFRIELGEIEAVINQYSAVGEAVVVIRKDSTNSQRIVAYIVPQKEQSITISEVRGFLESKLPSYMMPTNFVMLEALPLTPNGKIDRKALPALDTIRPEFEKTFVAPQTLVEKQLAIIWMQILGLEKIGINDNFFELGGHSLLATRLTSRINKTFEIELQLRLLFEFPTIAQLAKSIEDKKLAAKSFSPIEQVSREIQLPLSFAQKRLWFLYKLDPNSCVYNGSTAILLQGSLNVKALEQSINEIVRRHEILRTYFQTIDGQPIQIIDPGFKIPLLIIDLQDLPNNKHEADVDKLRLADYQKPFDLTQPPLLRLTLLRLKTKEYILLVTMHHIISDAWSEGVFMREMSVLYEAFSNGKPSPLIEMNIQYADFATWQQNWLQDEAFDALLTYWEKQLGDKLPVLELPKIRQTSELKSSQEKRQTLRLSKKLSQAIKKLSNSLEITLFMMLFGAFNVLLYWYTGDKDIVVGTDIANRNRIETENLIGFFVNQLVLRSNLSGNPSFSEYLQQVRKVCLEAYAHQDLPFEKLVSALNPKRDLNQTPLFQVKFLLQNAPIHPLELSDLTLTPLNDLENAIARFDLLLELTDTE